MPSYAVVFSVPARDLKRQKATLRYETHFGSGKVYPVLAPVNQPKSDKISEAYAGLFSLE